MFVVMKISYKSHLCWSQYWLLWFPGWWIGPSSSHHRHHIHSITCSAWCWGLPWSIPACCCVFILHVPIRSWMTFVEMWSWPSLFCGFSNNPFVLFWRFRLQLEPYSDPPCEPWVSNRFKSDVASNWRKHSVLLFNIIYVFLTLSSVFLLYCFFCFPPPLCLFLCLLVFAVCYSCCVDWQESWSSPGLGNPKFPLWLWCWPLVTSEKFWPLRLWCTNNFPLPKEGGGDGEVLQQCGPSWAQPPQCDEGLRHGEGQGAVAGKGKWRGGWEKELNGDGGLEIFSVCW